MWLVVCQSLVVASMWAGSSILQKRFLVALTPEAALVAVGTLFFLLAVVLALWRYEHVFSLQKNQWSWRLLPMLLGSVVMGYLVAYYTLFHLIKHHEVHVVIALTYVTPLITLLLAVLFLGERVTPAAVLGCIMIVGGVVLVAASRPHKELP